MAPSDSEEEILEDIEYDGDDDPDAEAEDEPLDVAPDDATEEGDDDSASDDSEDGSDDEEDDDSEPSGDPTTMDVDVDAPTIEPISSTSREPSHPSPQLTAARQRSLSPAQLRKKALLSPVDKVGLSSSCTVEAICALPHPVPTHALASSLCMTHLLTGSDDGYIRDYDIFAAVNGKNFLTAPQRHHAGVVEGIMKSGQLRFWWENPVASNAPKFSGMALGEEDPGLSPIYSLTMHSDALWALAGTDTGHINLFTVRHEPGRLSYVMNGHRGPVSALSMSHDEKGFFSAGWDSEAIQWDLNTGQRVRTFTAHSAQLVGIAVRPLYSRYSDTGSAVLYQESDTTQSSTQDVSLPVPSNSNPMDASSEPLSATDNQPRVDSDARSDTSFDPLFDDEPEAAKATSAPAPSTHQSRPPQPPQPRVAPSQIPPPKNAPPLLDSSSYASYSSDLLMTAAIDGQIIIWDKRVHIPGKGVGRLWMSEKTPPWCLSACWSANGNQLYAGRRNGTVDVWDVRQLGRSGPVNTPRILRTLRNPLSSGVVSCVVAFPDCRHIACASVDNLRLWNVAEAVEPDSFGKTKSGVQFKIIPGHHGGYISQMLIDPGAKFLVSASSNRGWFGDSTRTVFVHDIKYS